MQINEITGQIVDSAMKVHTALGPGLLESAYEVCLAHELKKRGLHAVTQVGLPVEYGGVKLEVGYRLTFWSRIRSSWKLKPSPKFTPSMKHNSFPT